MKIEHVLVACLITILAACETPVVKEEETLIGEYYCVHKYDASKNFYYQGQVKSYIKQMFGEIVITFEYTTPNGESVIINSEERNNYICGTAI